MNEHNGRRQDLSDLVEELKLAFFATRRAQNELVGELARDAQVRYQETEDRLAQHRESGRLLLERQRWLAVPTAAGLAPLAIAFVAAVTGSVSALPQIIIGIGVSAVGAAAIGITALKRSDSMGAEIRDNRRETRELEDKQREIGIGLEQGAIHPGMSAQEISQVVDERLAETRPGDSGKRAKDRIQELVDNVVTNALRLGAVVDQLHRCALGPERALIDALERVGDRTGTRSEGFATTLADLQHANGTGVLAASALQIDAERIFTLAQELLGTEAGHAHRSRGFASRADFGTPHFELPTPRLPGADA